MSMEKAFGASYFGCVVETETEFVPKEKKNIPYEKNPTKSYMLLL